ncbi:MAG TPA: hypothetical protein VGC42_31115 [Kofleriaceae bacterium]
MRPWEHHGATQTAENPPVVVVASDAGVGGGKPRPKKKHRPAASEVAETTIGDPEEVDLGPTQVNLTSADRVLEWRGDDVSLPPQTLDMAGGAANRSLDDAEIAGVINNQAGGIKDCIVKAATGTDLKATITIKLIVDGRGRPGKSRVQAPRYLQDHGLPACTQRVLGRLQFPASGAPTLVTFPLTLG